MEKKNKIIFVVIILFIICIASISFFMAESMESNKNTISVTDMVDRNVQVPEHINTVIGTSPSMTILIYMLAPDQLAAVNFEWKEEELQFIPDKYKDYPAIGGWYGKNTGNYEEIISLNPDVVIESVRADDADLNNLNERQSNLGNIPVVGIYNTNELDNNTNAILFIGYLLGQNESTHKLIDFNQENLDLIKNVTNTIDNPVTVYYADGNSGLKTYGPNSEHTQLIRLCGGNNVVKDSSDKAIDVSIEQVIKWNPDVIICNDKVFFDNVYTDPGWLSISAVQNHMVYKSPNTPFDWFNHPPGLNLIIGLPWVAKILYPDEFKDLDLVNKTQYFYSNFYHYDLNKEETNQLLLDSGMNKYIL